jgi:release factor glutamine methyltransferase
MARQGAQVTAVDKSPLAVTNTRENTKKNKLDIRVIQSDLFTDVPERFDVITFNPPYLPTGFPKDDAWDGGTGGIEVTKRFLSDAYTHVTDNGRIYLLLSTRGDIQKLLDHFKQQYHFQKLDTLPFFFEQIMVYEITH